MFTISPLQETARAALDAFKQVEWPEVDRQHYPGEEPDFTRYDEVYVATTENGNIAGYLHVTGEAGIAHIHSLIVGKDYRRKGLATEFLKTAEAAARSWKVHKIWLETGAAWDARNLYESSGYTVRTLLPKHYGKQDFILLDKEL